MWESCLHFILYSHELSCYLDHPEAETKGIVIHHELHEVLVVLQRSTLNLGKSQSSRHRQWAFLLHLGLGKVRDSPGTTFKYVRDNWHSISYHIYIYYYIFRYHSNSFNVLKRCSILEILQPSFTFGIRPGWPSRKRRSPSPGQCPRKHVNPAIEIGEILKVGHCQVCHWNIEVINAIWHSPSGQTAEVKFQCSVTLHISKFFDVQSFQALNSNFKLCPLLRPPLLR